MYRVTRFVRPEATFYRQIWKLSLLQSCAYASSLAQRQYVYDGVDLREGREVRSSISNTFVLDPTEALLQGNGSQYLDEMLQSWKAQPNSVHPSWQQYFEGNSNQIVPLSSRYLDASDSRLDNAIQAREPATKNDLLVKVVNLITSYQRYGHYVADIDPIHLNDFMTSPAELELSYHDLEDADLDKPIRLDPGLLFKENTVLSLRDIVEKCKSLYCATYGVEFIHIPDHEKRAWLQERIRTRPESTPKAEKKRILQELMFAATFECFLATKYPHDKRYGLDGAEGVAVTAATILDHAADEFGTEKVVVGSCHRGRMTMLPCVWRKPMEAIFAEFQGATNCDPDAGRAGDVKYHLGQDGKRRTHGGKDVHISLLPNPSHLEVISAVAAGKAYASRGKRADSSKVLSLALHGDAAFAGQGVVYEALGLSKLPTYNVGGTIRVMVNNQIGFTTDRASARSSHYCTDVLKYLDIPIFHVNGDDVETLAWASKLAVEWHAKFQSDIVIDVVCYRKYGHNEIDQPGMTQPLMYRNISALKPPLDRYIEKLVEDGCFTVTEIEAERQRIWDDISQEYSRAQDRMSKDVPSSSITEIESDGFVPATFSEPLAPLMKQLSTVPRDVKIHKTVSRILEARNAAFAEGIVDWATAEALAFGSLIKEGYNVRLTGQDVQRGTFSQRHTVLHDQETGKKYIPLQNLGNASSGDARVGNFLAANSPLTEYAALAFEYGHSTSSPNTLTMWEAQFGDFANLAQVVIDNLIASGRSKWQIDSNLVISLPHGYDGQAAEHSSARLERFLSLCDENGLGWPAGVDKQFEHCNMQIVCPTTPANYFHILRRQMLSKHKRPLVTFFSKSLLRHPINRSSVSELESNTSAFQPVLTDPATTIVPISVTRVIICTGQLYAALHAHRQDNKINDTAILRLEQLHPFPFESFKETLELYKNAKKIIWAQEEPYNGGAWHYVRDRFDTVSDRMRSEGKDAWKARCVSRPVSAVSAVGSKKVSDREQARILEECLR